jgi:hypothetical protein
VLILDILIDALGHESFCHFNSIVKASLVEYCWFVTNSLVIFQEVLGLLYEIDCLLVVIVRFLLAVFLKDRVFDLALKYNEVGALIYFVRNAQVNGALDVFTTVTFFIPSNIIEPIHLFFLFVASVHGLGVNYIVCTHAESVDVWFLIAILWSRISVSVELRKDASL